MNEIVLTLYVVYRFPSDYPGKWVVRRQYVVRGREEPRKDLEPMIVTDTLDRARGVLPEGLYNIGRKERDVPSIFEVWI